MGIYTFSEFKQAFTTLGVSTISEFKMKLPNLNQDLRNPEEFKKLYRWVFDFSKEPGFKNVQIDTAVALWELLLNGKCKFLNDWISFLKDEKKD